MKTKNPKKALREKEVWKWITKEMPYKHSDRFVPLFKIIRTQIQKARKEGVIEGMRTKINKWEETLLKARQEEREKFRKIVRDVLFEKYLEFDDTERVMKDINKALKEPDNRIGLTYN